MPAHDDHLSQLFADAYSDLIEAAPVAPTLEEITTLSVNSSTGGKPPRKTSKIWVAIAAAAAVVIVIGLVPLLVNTQETPSADTVVPTTLVESTPTTLGELVLIPGSWSRVPHDEAVFGGRPRIVRRDVRWEGAASMSSVTAGGPGLVAVGSDEVDAAVWTSVDGITWSRVPHDESVFGGGDMSMSSVTVGGPGLVAVGSDGEILADVPDVDAAIWTSPDGVTWSRVPHNEEVFGGAWINSVTAGGPGLVAVGGTEGVWTGGDAVVWTSVDGFTWSRVPHDETVFGGNGVQQILSVTAGGPGLVAVGMNGGIGPWDNNPDTNAAVWTSVDGITWSRVPHDENVFSSEGSPSMLAVTVGGPGLVAVGAELWPSPSQPSELARTPVWTSPDGVTWTRVPHDATVTGALTSVTAGGPGLVAVGLDTWEANGVWTSADGITWSRVPVDEARFGSWPDWISEVTVGGPGLVAVGVDSGDAAVWVAEED